MNPLPLPLIGIVRAVASVVRGSDRLARFVESGATAYRIERASYGW